MQTGETSLEFMAAVLRINYRIREWEKGIKKVIIFVNN